MQGSAVNTFLTAVLPPTQSVMHEKSDALCGEGPRSPVCSAERGRPGAPRLREHRPPGHGGTKRGKHLCSSRRRPLRRSNHALPSRLPLLHGKPRALRALGSLRGALGTFFPEHKGLLLPHRLMKAPLHIHKAPSSARTWQPGGIPFFKAKGITSSDGEVSYTPRLREYVRTDAYGFRSQLLTRSQEKEEGEHRISLKRNGINLAFKDSQPCQAIFTTAERVKQGPI